MADYYTNFSLVLKLANETEQTYALDLAHKASLIQQGNELPADFPKTLVDVIEDWQFETDADNSGATHGLWLHSMYGGVDAVCVSSNTCSRNSIHKPTSASSGHMIARNRVWMLMAVEQPSSPPRRLGQ